MPEMTIDELKQEADSAADNLWSRGFFKKRRLKRERDALKGRLAAVAFNVPENRLDKDTWRSYYAELVRQEAVRDVADRMLNPTSAADLQKATDRWLGGVRLHDESGPRHLFKDKLRGHGQGDGSTDGRLRRKLVKEAIQHIIRTSSSHHLASLYDKLKESREILNGAERQLQINPDDKNIQARRASAEQLLLLRQKAVSDEVVKMLDNLRNMPGGSLALKKAIFLTQEKLRDPEGYKQKYARIVPFDDRNDPNNPNKWVKASRRFYTPSEDTLLLPDQEDGTPRTNNAPVNMGHPPDGLPFFGLDTREELIHDVGQESLDDCWLQASAASLPRPTLGNMFSWRPSYGSEGVTTRLHDEQGKPMYIRTQQNQLWNDASSHKALQPAALEAAAAKVGRSELRKFRGTKPRDPKSGLPTYSVYDLYDNTAAAASKLLTGKDPIIDESVFDQSPNEKQRFLSGFWRTAQILGANKGVATFGNFNDPNGQDTGPGHIVTWLNTSRDGTLGNFGNPWMVAPGIGTTTVSKGHKIFDADTSRVRHVSFLDPAGADPANDRFVPAPSAPRQRRLLGNFMI